MRNLDNLCMGCMKETDGGEACPHCGFHADSPQISPYLPLRTVLNERYLVGKLLNHNGDGGTYIGYDMVQNSSVFIREFLPDAITLRSEDDLQLKIMAGCDLTFKECYQSFLDLWRNLARMRGLSALISVYDIFEENGTAYAVADYIEGITLHDYLMRSTTGYLTWEQARTLFMPALSTLGTLHTAGVIHRGISPKTLLIGKDGKMHLTGFSIWQARTARGDLTAELFPGYSAIEQYGFEGQQGQWTDIYSFTATLYRALTGNTPLEATVRVTNDKLMVPTKIAERIPSYVLDALGNALQILPTDRTRDVERLRAELSASPTVAAMNSTDTSYVKKKEPPKKPQKTKKTDYSPKKTAIITAIITGIVLLILFGILSLTVFRSKMFPSWGASQTTATTAGNASTTSSEMIEVPNFIEQSYATVSTNPVWSQDFKFEPSYEYNDQYSEGEIFSQSPKAHTKINKGSTIVLKVSKGIEQVLLPQLVGITSTDAQKQLSDAGFKVKILKKSNDGSHVKDTVAFVTPASGATYPKGTEVVLQVWGDPPAQDIVPSTTASAF